MRWVAAIMLVFILMGGWAIVEDIKLERASAQVQIAELRYDTVRAEMEARRVEAQESTKQVYAREDGKTERAQTFGITMATLAGQAQQNGIPQLLTAILTLVLGYLYLQVRDLQRKKHKSVRKVGPNE